MQRNVSPLTAIIVVLVALGIAALAWVRLSTGPKPTTRQERGARRESGGSRRGGARTTGNRSAHDGGRRGGSRGGGRRGGQGGERAGGRAGGRQGGAAAEAQPTAGEQRSEAPAAPARK
jgi:hypothetical protein